MSELQPSVDWQATCEQLRQALAQQKQEIERIQKELDHHVRQRCYATEENLKLKQEIERLTVDLQERRTICRKATQAIIDAIGSDGPENIDHAVDRLIAKLSAMKAEVRRLQEELKRYKHD